MTAAGLSLHRVGKCFETRGAPLVVLREASLTLAPGESAAIVGPSGSGKSTLLHIAGALERPTSGEVLIDGESPFELDDRALAAFRNHRVGFVFQDHHLLPQCSAMENVLIPTFASAARKGVARDGASTAAFHANARRRAAELLARVGLDRRFEHRPAELSGGERQRVAIARALINRPRVILADEPTGNLDADNADEIAALFAAIHRAEDAVLLVVTHSPSLAARMDRVFELRKGVLSAAPSGEGR